MDLDVELIRGAPMSTYWRQAAWELAYRKGLMSRAQYRRVKLPSKVTAASTLWLGANIARETYRNRHVLQQYVERQHRSRYLGALGDEDNMAELFGTYPVYYDQNRQDDFQLRERWRQMT